MIKRPTSELKKGVNFIGVGTIFFCHNGHGKFLMSKRSQNCRDEKGRWESGGGSLDFGETPEECATREIREEYSTKPSNLKQIGTLNVIRNIDGLKTHWILLIFIAKLNPKQVKIGEPEYTDEIGWYNLDNLPKPTHSQMSRVLKIIRPHL